MRFHFRIKLRTLHFQGCRIITEQRHHGLKIYKDSRQILSQYYILFHTIHVHVIYMNTLWDLAMGKLCKTLHVSMKNTLNIFSLNINTIGIVHKFQNCKITLLYLVNVKYKCTNKWEMFASLSSIQWVRNNNRQSTIQILLYCNVLNDDNFRISDQKFTSFLNLRTT